jgi:hypothetical protein
MEVEEENRTSGRDTYTPAATESRPGGNAGINFGKECLGCSTTKGLTRSLQVSLAPGKKIGQFWVCEECFLKLEQGRCNSTSTCSFLPREHKKFRKIGIHSAPKTTLPD